MQLRWMVAATACLARFAIADQIISTFDSGTDGWVAAPGSNAAVTHRASGGNPGGFLHVDPTDGADLAVLLAPQAFLGNLSRFHHGRISWDGNTLQAGGPDYFAYGTLEISGPGGSVSMDIVAGRPPSGTWTTYGCDLVASTFGVTEAQLTAVLTNVTSITLNVEGIFGAEMQGIDNFRIETCHADFNGDGFVAGTDFDDFVIAFEAGELTSDFNHDGFVNGVDFDEYVLAFELGC